ncbi:hypothetical protein [Providencia hangzhouensis]
MEKFLTATSIFIEKSTDTKYFLLFTSFLILTDIALLNTINISILQLTYADITNKLAIGVVLVYMALFLFYVSILMPVVSYVLFEFIKFASPRFLKIFPDVNEGKLNKEGYISIDILKNEAVLENNSVKLNLYLKQESKNNDELRLYQLAFTCLITSCLSFMLVPNGTSTLLGSIFTYGLISGNSWNILVSVSMLLLMGYCIFLGIGGYCLYRFTDRYVYLMNNKHVNP